MKVCEFISNYRNHPVLFIGAGVSLRYLENSYTWDGLLQKISYELKSNPEFYLDIKSSCENEGVYDYTKIATILEEVFNESLHQDRDGKFKNINDEFYAKMGSNINISRLKIYIAELLKPLEIKDTKSDEVAELKKTRKNIASIITTNYDCFIEGIFDFQPLIGNDILLSNPYGSAYKIHGCISDPLKIIITEKDYKKFNEKYELIRAQLLSLFIHNPIIFMGYGIGDENIKSLLKTIFTYVEPNSESANKIRDNFLLVEYEEGSDSLEVGEHDIDLEGFSTIRINKIRTDDYTSIYRALSELTLPISAMDVRKVQDIVKEIYSGGTIKVSITEDLDSLNNSDKIIAIGSSKTITYQYQTSAEMMSNYFKIIDESNSQLLVLINKHKIQTQQYFPIFGFSCICDEILNVSKFKEQQKCKIKFALDSLPPKYQTTKTTIKEITEDDGIPISHKENALLWGIMQGYLSLDEVETYLRTFEEKMTTQYRKLLCGYDIKKYGLSVN